MLAVSLVKSTIDAEREVPGIGQFSWMKLMTCCRMTAFGTWEESEKEDDEDDETEEDNGDDEDDEEDDADEEDDEDEE